LQQLHISSFISSISLSSPSPPIQDDAAVPESPQIASDDIYVLRKKVKPASVIHPLPVSSSSTDVTVHRTVPSNKKHNNITNKKVKDVPFNLSFFSHPSVNPEATTRQPFSIKEAGHTPKITSKYNPKFFEHSSSDLDEKKKKEIVRIISSGIIDSTCHIHPK
jgi:hypothetical protein